MIVQKNKPFRKLTLKQFTLTAIASAILVFHADMASADSCDPIISNTVDGTCDFDTGSSVTVANGGSVGGINMNGYDAGAGGQIAIDAGGQINSTTTGIHISSSTLSNGLINNGTINTGSYGIAITASTVGGITNNGNITSQHTGIFLEGSTITGNITNNGIITANGDTDGIVVDAHSQVNGDIINNGTINSGPSGAGILVRSDSTVGNIINNGSINSKSGTGITLSNVSHITGELSNTGQIVAGKYGINVSNDSNNAVGSISNSGSIRAGETGILIHSSSGVGSISNTGTITGGNDGIRVEDTSNIVGSITNSGTIQGGTGAGQYAIYVDPGSTVAGGINIVGQHARVIGNVEAVGTDFNITSGAVFTSEGTFDVNNFNIASGAVFNMANDITTQDAMNNAGTLSVGTTTHTLTGDYVQDSGGVFQTVIGNGTYGQLAVTGGVDLSQSGKINVALTSNSTLHTGEVFSNIISGNTLTGPTDGFDVTDSSPLWKFIAETEGAGINLTATINASAYNICQGTYCEGAANTILGQLAAGNSAFDAYNSLTTDAAFQTAASQATPEMTNENIEALQMITSSVMDVLPMWNILHGESEDASLYQPDRVWVKPYGGSIVQDDNETVPGFNATAYGVVTGIDTQPATNWLVGSAIAAGGDNMQGSSVLNTQSLSSAAFQGMLYGTRELSHHLYLAGQASVGYQNNDSNRSIPLYSDTATGSFDSWLTNLRTQFGWNYMPTTNLVLTPDIEATYLFINQGSYTESGSPMDLSVDSNNNSSLILGAYGNGVYHLATLNNNAQKLNLTAYAGVARNTLNSQPQTDATFVAGGPSFFTYGTQFNGFVFRGGVGLEIAGSTAPLSLSLNYDVQAGNNAYSNFGSATLSYKF